MMKNLRPWSRCLLVVAALVMILALVRDSVLTFGVAMLILVVALKMIELDWRWRHRP